MHSTLQKKIFLTCLGLSLLILVLKTGILPLHAPADETTTTSQVVSEQQELRNRLVNQEAFPSLFRSCPPGYELKPCANVAMPDLQKLDDSPYDVPICVDEEQYTVLILTHGENRVKMLMESLANYVKMKRVHKVVVLWNNFGIEPPDVGHINNTAQIVFVTLPENKLRLRFSSLKEIETQGTVC